MTKKNTTNQMIKMPKEYAIAFLKIFDKRTDNLMLMQAEMMKLQTELYHEKWKFRYVRRLLKAHAPHEAARGSLTWTFLAFVAAYVRLLRNAILLSFSPLEVQIVLHSKGRSISTRDFRLLTSKGELRAVPVSGVTAPASGIIGSGN